MHALDLIGRYFWLLCIGITLINFRLAAKPFTTTETPGTSRLDVLRRRMLMAMIAPWLVMGAGIVFGNVPGVWNYFRPQDLNPYVWAWYLSIMALSCGFAFWVLVAGGACKVVQLGLIRASVFGRSIEVSERWVKVYAAVGPPFVVVWIWLAWHLDAPLPKGAR